MIIRNKDFCLAHTFECGQCFRWNLQPDGSYIGVVQDKVIKIWEENGAVVTDCTDTGLIEQYFDLNRDYTPLKNTLRHDAILQAAIEYGYGIRLLKQQPWEALVSFIISANNNIPRIKKIIEALCRNFGSPLQDGYYSFPSASVLSKLTLEDLAVIKSGYRAGYILDAAKKVQCGDLDLEAVYAMHPDQARAYLKQVKGVGDKVADCILLFAYQKFAVFPKDVWIKRTLHRLYGLEERDFDTAVAEKFGALGGFAQQYLFYYERERS